MIPLRQVRDLTNEIIAKHPSQHTVKEGCCKLVKRNDPSCRQNWIGSIAIVTHWSHSREVAGWCLHQKGNRGKGGQVHTESEGDADSPGAQGS